MKRALLRIQSMITHFLFIRPLTSYLEHLIRSIDSLTHFPLVLSCGTLFVKMTPVYQSWNEVTLSEDRVATVNCIHSSSSYI